MQITKSETKSKKRQIVNKIISFAQDKVLIDKKELQDLRAYASIGKDGICVHSKWVEGCVGCMVRELSRALAVAYDLNYEATSFPYRSHGVEFKTRKEAIRFIDDMHLKVQRQRFPNEGDH